MFPAPLPSKSSSSFGSQSLIVGLALIPLTAVALASVPAIAIMLFVPNGSPRIEKHLAIMISWTMAILTNSRVIDR